MILGDSILYKDLISNVFSAGTDAALNLFQVTITPYSSQNDPVLDEEDTDLSATLSFRVENFPIPSFQAATVAIPYQGASFKLTAPGNPLDRSFTIPIRIDKNFAVYKMLQKACAMDENGLFEKDNYVKEATDHSRMFSIDVACYTPGKEKLTAVALWKFHHCILTSLESMQVSYQSADAATVNATFIYTTFENIIGES